MSVQSEIDRIITSVGNAYSKVSEKGGTVPASQTVANLAMAIGSIPAGVAKETWVIKSDASGEFSTTQIAFTSNGQKFTSIGATYTGLYVVLCYDNVEVAGYDPGTGGVYEFDPEVYRKLTFDTPPTGALLTWLQSNATKQAATVNKKDFLYGIPLIYNSGWKYNSWNITYTGNNRANIAIAGNAIVG